jgi:hypothetical protein
MAGCASSSDVSSLHDAVDAVLNTSNFKLVTTTSDPQGTVVDNVVIEKPDRFSSDETINGIAGSNVVAIGSSGYVEDQTGRWTSLRHVDESRDLTNAALVYLHLLDMTTAATRHGNTFVVPTDEAVRLSASIRLVQAQTPSRVSLSATVRAGLLRSMTLRIAGGSPAYVTMTVDGIGSSPKIEPPTTGPVG